MMMMMSSNQGVRAGGGIGDEIEPPDGDDYEVYRILFDITFFFFIIVILLAIIQGEFTTFKIKRHDPPGSSRMIGLFFLYRERERRRLTVVSLV